MQKMKKKAHLQTQDPVVVFYRFGTDAKYLNLAVEKEVKAIANAVKKPFHHDSWNFGLVNMVYERGTIEEEDFELKLCYPGVIFNPAEM